jgi:GTP-binding protein
LALAFFIDLSDDNYLTAYTTLLHELGSYAPDLVQKPRIIIGTKIDEEGTQERLLELQSTIKEYDVLPLSNITGEGLDDIKKAFIHITYTHKDEEEGDGFTTVVDNDAEYRDHV